MLASAAEARPQVDSAATDSMGAPTQKPHGELTLRLGNESNKPDGILGPFTYGVLAGYAWDNGWKFDGTFMRLHEPGTPMFASFLDEGKITLSMPEASIAQQSVVLAATGWWNRTVDMYTNVGGLEIASPISPIALNAGLYAGTATRDEESGRFLGYLIGASTTLGPVEVTASYVAGAIKTPGDPSTLGAGSYRKTALEAAVDLPIFANFPTAITFDVERRFFDFGNNGPRIEPIDTYIFVLGLEINVAALFAK